MIGKLYDNVWVGVAEVSREEGGKPEKVIGLSFPLPNPPYPDSLDHEDNFEDVFIPVSVAKTLLVDLRDAVDATVEGKPFR